MHNTNTTKKRRAAQIPSAVVVGLVAVVCGNLADKLAAAPLPMPSAPLAQLPDETVLTHHRISLHGRELKYTARAGFITLRDHSQQPRGKIFFVAYTLNNGGNPSSRPLTFLWNGGPGSPASMVQLGMAGPRRVAPTKTPPRYQLIDNESTWLQFTDLVFVDPVGTGYSYPVKPEYGPDFWSTQGDIQSIAEFMRIYRQEYDRTQSPLFIGGESYGTTRAAGLAEALEQDRGKDFAGGFINHFPLRGVILLSGSLNDSLTFSLSTGNAFPYVLYLPSYTAAAFMHKKLTPELESNFQSTYEAAERWALTGYTVALLQGARLPAAEREATAKELARYTGLGEKFIEKSDLRVNLDEFASHLLEAQGLVLGHYDMQIAYKGSADAPYDFQTDRSLFADGIGSLIVPYLHDELGFKTNAFYAGPFAYGWPPRTSDWVGSKWDTGTQPERRSDDAAALANAIRQNPSLHVFWASGYFDPGTAFASQYVFDHMKLDAQQRTRVEMKDYPGGHMIYMSADNRQRLEQDVSGFERNAMMSTSEAHAQ